MLWPMRPKENNFAFIDSQNVNLGVRGLGWRLDFKRFRTYLAEKYNVSKAYLFLGYLADNEKLYAALREDGYILIFKPIISRKEGAIKGNCDAELVLQTMHDLENYDRAVIVTGDGDFYCLIKYLIERQKLAALIVPDRNKFSALLNFRICRPYLRFVNDLKTTLALKKKGPARTGP
jgi:uncharacterized LabA/DUF88 family protein